MIVGPNGFQNSSWDLSKHYSINWDYFYQYQMTSLGRHLLDQVFDFFCNLAINDCWSYFFYMFGLKKKSNYFSPYSKFVTWKENHWAKWFRVIMGSSIFITIPISLQDKTMFPLNLSITPLVPSQKTECHLQRVDVWSCMTFQYILLWNYHFLQLL